MSWEEYRHEVQLWAARVRKTKAKLELSPARDLRNNRNGLYKCVTHKRKVKNNVNPLINNTGKLVTVGEEKAELLNNSFCLSFLWEPLFSHLLCGWTVGQGMGSKRPPVRNDHVCDYLRNLNVHKLMEPDEIHPKGIG